MRRFFCHLMLKKQPFYFRGEVNGINLFNNIGNRVAAKKTFLDGTLLSLKCYGVVSAPHFYNSNPSIELAIDGLKSDIDKHDTYLDIEPLSGITICP